MGGSFSQKSRNFGRWMGFEQQNREFLVDGSVLSTKFRLWIDGFGIKIATLLAFRMKFWYLEAFSAENFGRWMGGSAKPTISSSKCFNILKVQCYSTEKESESHKFKFVTRFDQRILSCAISASSWNGSSGQSIRSDPSGRGPIPPCTYGHRVCVTYCGLRSFLGHAPHIESWESLTQS